MIEDLSPKGKTLWRRCKARRFDIGIESGTAETKKFKALCLSLRPETLKRISALNAEALITVYSPPSAPVKKGKTLASQCPKPSRFAILESRAARRRREVQALCLSLRRDVETGFNAVPKH